MAKLKEWNPKAPATFGFFCPGCSCSHAVPTYPMGQPNPGGATWAWNGSLDSPTLEPSINCEWGDGHRCHSFVRNGKIQFLGDCDHALAGKTVDLPEWEDS